MQTFWQDLRYGARMLMKNPGFTLIAVLILALGIGANTAIFSLLDGLLIRPLPYHEPDRLALIWEDATSIGFPRDTPAPANYADWKAQNHVFEDMAALDNRSFNLVSDGEPEKLMAYGVTANFFPLLGVTPVLGRNFLPEEDRPGAPKVAIISHRLWQNRFGGDQDILNRELLLNDQKYRVVGVMPANFQFYQRYINLWVPVAFSSEELANRGGHYLNVVGRMKPGVTIAQADADIKSIMQRIAQTSPDEAQGLGAVVVSLRDEFTGDVRQSLWVLLAAVGFVLLIACANIASLMLARAAARTREIAVRAALGAGRWRIVRQLLTESLLLAILGGALGVLLALWSFEFLRQLIPVALAGQTSLQLDGRVMLFTLLASLVSGVLFGLMPALQASRLDLNEALKESGSRSGLGAGQRRLRNVLVVGEVALAIVLLIGSGLLIQTLYNLQGQYSPLRPESVLTLRTVLPEYKYGDHARRVAFYNQVLERVQALPGVISAGYTTSVPLEWKGGANGLSIEGRQAEAGLGWNANHRQVTDQYLQTMSIALRQGRYFNPQDQEQSEPVAIINEAMAQKYWPNESALGKRFKMGSADSNQPWLKIVGIVADVRQMGISEPVKPEMYVPQRQIKTHPFFTPRDLAIRASVDPMSLTDAVRTAIHAVDPAQPVTNIRTMEEVLGEQSAQRRIGMILLSIFAALAMLLAAIGLYGVLSYFVAQHTPEIGVRMALGAQMGDVLRLVLRQGLTLVFGGVVLGIVGALALTRLMASLVFGVATLDPLTFAVVPLLFCGVGLLACWLPARRATKVDPMIALRCE
ncbi:MAG: ABC transporter permease [Acidobacteria bacterium]|nr:ABC transporter permease [Acidobacteriota bacterium]